MTKFMDKLRAKNGGNDIPVTEVKEWHIPKVGKVRECVQCHALVKGEIIRCVRCLRAIRDAKNCERCLGVTGVLARLVEAALNDQIPDDLVLSQATAILEAP